MAKTGINLDKIIAEYSRYFSKLNQGKKWMICKLQLATGEVIHDDIKEDQLEWSGYFQHLPRDKCCLIVIDYNDRVYGIHWNPPDADGKEKFTMADVVNTFKSKTGIKNVFQVDSIDEVHPDYIRKEKLPK